MLLLIVVNIFAMLMAQNCFEPGPNYHSTEDLTMDEATKACLSKGGQVVNPDHLGFFSAVISADLLDTFIWTDAKPKKISHNRNRKKYFFYSRGFGAKAKKSNGKFIAYNAKNRGCLIAKSSAQGEVTFGRIQCFRKRKAICEMMESYRPQIQYSFYTQESFGKVLP